MNNQNVAADYEMYQRQQKEALAFFNRIKGELIESGEEKINNELLSLIQKLENDKEYAFTIEEYCLLGNLTYLVGLDMTGTRENFLKMPVDNFFKRFEEVKLTSKEFADNFNKILSLVGEKNIVPVKDEMKDYLTRDVKGEAEQLHNLRLAYKKAFKTFQIPVNYAVSLGEMFSNKTLTYQDVLKFNSMIYEHTRFARHSIKNVIEIFAMPFYIQTIQEAEKMAQTQRFSIVYFDCILSARELRENHPDFTNFLHDEDKRINYSYMKADREEVEKKENEEAVAQQEAEKPDWDEKFHPTNPLEAQRFQVDHPDFFLRSVLEEFLHRGIKKPSDIIEAMDNMLQNPDYASQFYQWMAANNKSDKRVEYKEVWGEIMPDSIKAVIGDRIDEKREDYKKAVELITKDIPDENINRIVTYVNDVIQNLVIDGSEQKGYLLTQTFENQVKTWKHLQEMLQIIEQQYIDGSQYDSYVILYNYLKENTNFKEIMDNVEIYQRNEIEISLYTQLKQFIFPKKEEVEVKPETAE